jgi:hypothetical protein
MPAARKNSESGSISLGYRHGGIFGRPLYERHINAQEAVEVSSFSLAEIISGSQFDNALERPIIDLHDQETAFGSAAAIGPVAADAKTVSFYSDFQMFAPHASEFDFDD